MRQMANNTSYFMSNDYTIIKNMIQLLLMHIKKCQLSSELQRNFSIDIAIRAQNGNNSKNIDLMFHWHRQHPLFEMWTQHTFAYTH